MKTKKRGVNGRAVNAFGYYLHILLIVIGVVSFLLALGFTGSCELDLISLKEYAVKAFTCVAVMGASLYLNARIFN